MGDLSGLVFVWQPTLEYKNGECPANNYSFKCLAAYRRQSWILICCVH